MPIVPENDVTIYLVVEDFGPLVIDRAYEADDALTDGTKRFLDRHIDVERRPTAPSVLRLNRLSGKQSA
jgi:hypothetical protein